MKKSVWIFLFAVMLPSAVLGWLALRSAEEQQIVFERRTAQLYQKETEALAGTVRDAVESERRQFGETVHRLLANGDAEKLAHDFANTLTDAWPRKAVGFALDGDGKLISPVVTPSTTNQEWRKFLQDNRSFICSSEPATVYAVQNENPTRIFWGSMRSRGAANTAQGALAGNRSQSEPVDPQRNESAALPKEAERRADQRTATSLAGTSPAAGAFAPAKSAGADESQALRTAVAKISAPTDAIEPADKLKQAGSPAPETTTLAEATPAKPSMPAGANRMDLPAPAPQAEKKDVSATSTSPVVGSSAPIATGASPLVANDAQPTSGKPVTTPARDNRGGLALDAKAKREMAGNGQALGDTKDRDAEAAKARPSAPPAPKPGAAETAQATVESQEKFPGLQSPKVERMAARPQPVGQIGNNHADAAPLATATRKNPGGKLDGSVEPNINANAKEQQKAPEADAARDQAAKVAMNRQVEPQQLLGSPSAAVSMLTPETADFSKLTADSDEGIVSRFVQDKLEVIFWLRPPEAPQMIFGCLVEAANLADLWKSVLERHPRSSRNEFGEADGQPGYVMTLLDDRGHPVATHPANAGARDWKRPFVASEIGEALPHWEAALYLASPTALADSARGLWRTLAFVIAGAVSLIALGGWLVVADARRQLALAQQKTDFVSTVSHELKTPLTSIRMFAELMHDRPQPPEKQGQYLRIITVEAERLTRLINNVLDFAKLGRKQKRVEKKPIDLHATVSRLWESHALHLRDAGFETRWEAAPGPYPMLGDDDALSQALVNLFSNAEKYSPDRKEVQLHTWIEGKWVNVSVLDRGLGVPKGEERKIFEAFYRAHDSLSSGIQGSGLGLTLAQHVAHEHGGEITFERRDGGGSRFTMRLPLSPGHTPGPADSAGARPRNGD